MAAPLCGFTQAADVGVTLCEAEVSVAAPLTCKSNSVRSLVHLISEGRCTLVVQCSITYYIMCYAWVQASGTAPAVNTPSPPVNPPAPPRSPLPLVSRPSFIVP